MEGLVNDPLFSLYFALIKKEWWFQVFSLCWSHLVGIQKDAEEEQVPERAGSMCSDGLFISSFNLEF